jgi:superoxide dismutase
MSDDIRNYITLLEAAKPDRIDLEPLRYGQGDLAPILSESNVSYHYDVLSRGYVDRYNNGEGDPDFNLGGARLHNLFWMQMKPPSGANPPKGLIKDVIGDKTALVDVLIDEGMKIQGSGWVYLAKDGTIKATPNQTWRSDIIMPIDMWEHSFSDYWPAKDAKKRYIKAILRCIDWQVINDRLNSR